MFAYQKRLQYPIDIKKKDLKLAKCLLSQYGGPYGELAASLQYLNQRFSMPDGRGKALLTDIGTEELGHVEMICTMIYQLMKGATIEDLESNMAGEQRARATYEHLMDLTDDPDVLQPLAFLRQREIIHYQRFKELKNIYQKELKK